MLIRKFFRLNSFAHFSLIPFHSSSERTSNDDVETVSPLCETQTTSRAIAPMSSSQILQRFPTYDASHITQTYQKMYGHFNFSSIAENTFL